MKEFFRNTNFKIAATLWNIFRHLFLNVTKELSAYRYLGWNVFRKRLTTNYCIKCSTNDPVEWWTSFCRSLSPYEHGSCIFSESIIQLRVSLHDFALNNSRVFFIGTPSISGHDSRSDDLWLTCYREKVTEEFFFVVKMQKISWVNLHLSLWNFAMTY